MSLRDLILLNWRLKLLSFLLAVLVWCTIRFSLERGVNHRDFGPLPVMVLKDSSDTQIYRLVPAEVAVSLSGPPNVLDPLNHRDIVVFVNLTGLQGASGYVKKVEISAPGNALLRSVDPPAVRVDRVAPALAPSPGPRPKP
jgi:hypothetical protein